MSVPPEFPGPHRIAGEPPPPREPREIARARTPDVVDDDTDRFGVEDAASRLAERLAGVEGGPARPGPDGRPLLSPAPTRPHDRIEGPLPGRATLVVFGAHATPSSRALGAVLDAVRDRHVATVGIVWRHYPDPAAHPRAAVFALAAEAAAEASRFWPLTRELLRLHHYDPADLHAAMVRAGLPPEETLEAMRAGTGTERIADDVASALSSGVTYAPALFVDGARLDAEIQPDAVLVALEAAMRT
jgi:Na+:H+ antiporter, NhaA family